MKVQIFSASVNPNFEYDLDAIKKMDFDSAVEYFKNDTINACSCYLREVDITKPNEFSFSAVYADTMFVWVKVL